MGKIVRKRYVTEEAVKKALKIDSLGMCLRIS